MDSNRLLKKTGWNIVTLITKMRTLCCILAKGRMTTVIYKNIITFLVYYYKIAVKLVA